MKVFNHKFKSQNKDNIDKLNEQLNYLQLFLLQTKLPYIELEGYKTTDEYII